MAIKYWIGDMAVMGPPYTKAEEADFYSRFAGCWTVLAGKNVAAKPPAQAAASAKKKKDRPGR
jgi:hypothetical protein